jgi:hypothetical protein
MQFAGESNPSTQPRNAQFSKKFHFWLDEPADWSRRVRWLRISGWCVTKSGQPLTAIRARLHGRNFEGRFDRERPEVAAYTGVANAPRWCGFTLDIEVPFGKGRLEVQVAGPHVPWQKFFAADVRGPLFPDARERQQHLETTLAEAPGRYHFWFDRPAVWDEPTSMLHIIGWCVDRRGGWIHGIRARIGSRKFEGKYGIPRTDIPQMHPDLPAAARSGFALAVPLPRGSSEIFLELKSADQQWHLFFSHPVEGKDETDRGETILPGEAEHFLSTSRPAPFAFWCDQPLDWKNPAGDLHISGWCVTTYGEPVTELRACLGRHVFPVKYGIPRPDIALAFDGHPSASRSGFSTEVTVPRGGGNFVLEGRGQNGVWKQIFSRRLGNPILARKVAGNSKPIKADG